MNGSCLPADLQYPLEWKNCLTLSEDDVWSQVIKNLKWKRLIINLFFTRNKKEKNR